MEKKIFTTKQFHLWPFYNGFTWRGFLPTYSVTVDNEGISFTINNNLIEKYTAEEVEASLFNSTWFGLGKTKIVFSKKFNCDKEKRGDHWYFFHNVCCYLDPMQVSEAINAFKEIDTKCFNDQSISLRDGKLWMTSDYIIEYDGNDKSPFWALSIPHIKYYYTQKNLNPFAKPLLVTGSDHPLRIENLNSDDIERLKLHIIENGAKLGDVSNVTFKHAFSFNVIFSPSLWFTSSTIGLGDEGVNFKQKTFKTNDNIFLPYDKINVAISCGAWYNLTREIYIYGEQNIIPIRKFWTSDAKRIVNELKEKGVEELEGEQFTESYHSSWFGVLLSIITLGIYHLIIMAISKKRKSIVVGKDLFTWNGDLWLFAPDKYIREKPKNNLRFFAAKADDIIDIYFYKRHWYHFWGYLFIWVRPSNIRSLAYEASQMTQDYDLEMGKIYSSKASKIKSLFEEKGYIQDSKRHKLYKSWIKSFIKNK